MALLVSYLTKLNNVTHMTTATYVTSLFFHCHYIAHAMTVAFPPDCFIEINVANDCTFSDKMYSDVRRFL